MDPQQLLVNAQDTLTARRVFGDPIQVDGATIIPVARIGGGGGGGNRADQAGAGFGLAAKPAGVFVVKDGRAAWRPAVDVNRIVLGGQIVMMTALLTIGRPIVRWLTTRRQHNVPAL